MTADNGAEAGPESPDVITITREEVEDQATAQPCMERLAEEPSRGSTSDMDTGSPASLLVRFVAKLIDLVAVAVPLVLVCGVLVLSDGLGWIELPWQLFRDSVPEVVAAGLSMFWALYALYAISAHAANGASIGKCICGIRVVPGDEPADKLAYYSARFVVACMGLLFLGAGHLCAAFRRDRRALHDLVVGSQVTKRIRHNE